jgi:toxin ParE1/3/4
MPPVRKHEAAKRDLVEHFVYLAENASVEVAERFLVSVEESLSDLARHPRLGAELGLRSPELTGIRKWHVKGFEKFLIFYQLRPDGVSIVRVLHAAQDWWQVLGIVRN